MLCSAALRAHWARLTARAMEAEHVRRAPKHSLALSLPHRAHRLIDAGCDCPLHSSAALHPISPLARTHADGQQIITQITHTNTAPFARPPLASLRLERGRSAGRPTRVPVPPAAMSWLRDEGQDRAKLDKKLQYQAELQAQMKANEEASADHTAHRTPRKCGMLPRFISDSHRCSAVWAVSLRCATENACRRPLIDQPPTCTLLRWV